ncbi:hypothetical protein PLICRDRAFT_53945 [Plicaturopsis crispa FD-325 SS-3]|nr:hypothetical protein PLICRDRAFT_53945 [Plicaturopsis crispa FD-325 SS-3]
MTTVLYMLSDELDAERARAVSAEADNAELRVQMRALIAERDRARTEVVQVRRALEEWQRRCGEAQQEIFRGQAILDRVEAQRLDAEADAARSRSTARQFKEELLVIRAREEGFEIGFKRGFARARNEAAGGNRYGQELVREDSDESDPSIETAFTTELPPPPPPPIERPRRSQSARPSTSSRHSHRTHDTALHAPTLPVPTLTTPLPVPSPSHAPPSRAASRTPVPIPVPAPLHAPEEIHPIPSRWHSRSPSCKSAADIPPDNWIPVSHGGGAMDIPPPHEMAPPPPSPSPRPIPAPPIPPPEEGMLFQPVRARDYAYPDGAQRQGQGRRSRASSMASRGSTHISELDIVSPPRGDPRNYPNDPRNNYPNDPRNSNYTNDPRGTTPRPPSQQQRRQTEIIAEQWRNANPDVHRGGAARANPDVGAAAARRHDVR